MIRPLFKSSCFNRSARKLTKRAPKKAAAIASALELLMADAFDPRLRTHKLSGELANSWACSAGYDLRIIFSILDHEAGEAIVLEDVGTHDNVY